MCYEPLESKNKKLTELMPNWQWQINNWQIGTNISGGWEGPVLVVGNVMLPNLDKCISACYTRVFLMYDKKWLARYMVWVGTVQSATPCGLNGPGIESRWGGARFSSPVQSDPGAQPASCKMGTGSFPAVKRPGRGVDHPPSSRAEVKERVELYVY